MDAQDVIKSIGTADELYAQSASGEHSLPRQLNNMHVHLPPNFSAFDTIDQVVDLAKEQGVKVLGVTNYYYHDVYDRFAEKAAAAGIFPSFGLEIISQIDELKEEGVRVNDPGNPGRMYICGKGITRFSDPPPLGAAIMNVIRSSDQARMEEMTEKLSAVFTDRGLASRITERDVVDMVARRHGSSPDKIIIQERHIAQAFQEMLFKEVEEGKRLETLLTLLGVESASAPDDAVSIQGEIRTHLMKAGKPAFVEENFVGFDEAFMLIIELGGIPCYPTLADGAKEICQYEEDIDVLVADLKARNIHAAELIPIRNEPDVLEEYVLKMREAGLVIVAGTEHNTLDLLSLDPKCVKEKEISDAVKDILWEGACVTAAHSFLVLNGECGFVDSEGFPNPGYVSDEERIEDFSKLGGIVIEKYMERG